MDYVGKAGFALCFLIAGFAYGIAAADSLDRGRDSATAMANVRITTPTFIDVSSIASGMAGGTGEFNVGTNYAPGVSVTSSYSEFPPAGADIRPANTVTGETSL